MSVEAMAIALHHSRARGSAKLVLLGIANHDGDGGAWPSVATLAKYAHVDRSNVQRAIQTLVDLGEIAREVQAGGTPSTADFMRPNLYIFQLRCPADCDGSRQHRRPSQPQIGGLSDPAALARPGSASAAPPAALARPEPSFNHLNQHTQESSSSNRVREHGCTHETIAGTDRCAIACRKNFDWIQSHEASA